MSSYLVQYAGAQRSAAGFGGEWDADRRSGSRRARNTHHARGRVWARVRSMLTDVAVPYPGPIVIAH